MQIQASWRRAPPFAISAQSKTPRRFQTLSNCGQHAHCQTGVDAAESKGVAKQVAIRAMALKLGHLPGTANLVNCDPNCDRHRSTRRARSTGIAPALQRLSIRRRQRQSRNVGVLTTIAQRSKRCGVFDCALIAEVSRVAGSWISSKRASNERRHSSKRRAAGFSTYLHFPEFSPIGIAVAKLNGSLRSTGAFFPGGAGAQPTRQRTRRRQSVPNLMSCRVRPFVWRRIQRRETRIALV